MTRADDRYCYCPGCGLRGIFAGHAPHGDEPCPQLVAESQARIAATQPVVLSIDLARLVVVDEDGARIGHLVDSR